MDVTERNISREQLFRRAISGIISPARMIPAKRILALPALLFIAGLFGIAANASDFDIIGVTPLRAVDPTLIGTGIYVNQTEASESGSSQFEVSPGPVGQPTNLFTWIGLTGSATTFPNSVGTESSHADGVASHFYHVDRGPSRGVSHVDNYLADVYYENVIVAGISNPARVVNQSFLFTGTPPDSVVNSAYDNYVARFGTIFSCAAGNNGTVYAPASAYNTIGVGVTDSATSIGGTPDGRAKPDLSAPGGATSFSAPYVSAAAAILLQATARGDAGTNVPAASDVRTIKALLMNGAVKPTNWMHTSSVPLDVTHGYGAGVLNVFNSYKQLSAGQHRAIETTTVTAGAAHPSGLNQVNESALVGWDFAMISTTGQDSVAHYYFNLPPTNGNYTMTASLVWNRQLSSTSINDLNLFLLRTTDNATIAASTSLIDNVEHIYLPSLPAGRYDLQVLKSGTNSVSNSETYAVAFENFVIQLNVAYQNGNVIISWPLAPSGFTLESTPNLSPPITWSTVTNPVVISNNFDVVTVNSLSGTSFYRLRR